MAAKKIKLASEQSFDDMADELIGSHKSNLTHGDNAEAIPTPEQNDLAFYQNVGRKLNEQWLR